LSGEVEEGQVAERLAKFFTWYVAGPCITEVYTMRENIVRFRASDIEMKKIKALKEVTGLVSMGETMRHFIDKAYDTEVLGVRKYERVTPEQK
jgi:hypothetical protein